MVVSHVNQYFERPQYYFRVAIIAAIARVVGISRKKYLENKTMTDPVQAEWISMPRPVKSWWLLTLAEKYCPDSTPPTDRVDRTYQPETMLVHAIGFDHHSREVIEHLQDAVQWLTSNGYMLQAPGQSDGIFLVSLRGYEYLDNGFLLPPTIDDLQHLHELIYEQVKDKYLLGQASYRAAVTDAFILTLDRVKSISGKTNTTGQDVRYLRNIFSNPPPNGLMTVPAPKSKAREELFAGSFAIYRNDPSHTFDGSESKQLCLDALHSASSLMRVLDDIESELLP